MASKKLKLSYLHPKYWLTWLVVGVSWLLAIIPNSWQFGLSSWIANRLANTGSRRISTIRRNIELCFPEENDDDRKALIRGNVQSSALMLFELLNMIWRKPSDMTSTARVIGIEHIEQALAADKPLLLVTGHFTPLFHAATQLASITPYNAVYRRLDNPVMEANLYQRGVENTRCTFFIVKIFGRCWRN